MRVSELARQLEQHGVPEARVAGASAADPDVRRACFDSRRVRPGDLFGALPGQRTDGMRFVAEALERGAAAVLCAAPGAGAPPVPRLLVAGVPAARAAGLAASILAGEPSRALWVAAVTGTNGKTTVVHLVQQALSARGLPCARCGTLGYAFDGSEEPALNTTPPGDLLQEWLASVRQRGAMAAVLEASSHGLAQERLAGLTVRAAAWTNLTHDHLDYHRDLEDYAAAKARLFRCLPPESVAFLPAADGRIHTACAAVAARVVPWALAPPGADPAALREGATGSGGLVGRAEAGPAGVVVEVEPPFGPARIRSPLPGRHNAENVLLAFGLVRAAGVAAVDAAQALESARGAPGRLERVLPDAPWRLYVDYAHTPDAIARVLAALREAHPDARVGIVFGAGGDRDPSKRGPMGERAARSSDWCLVTSDNPRSEDPGAIAAAVAAGVRAAGRVPEVILDRRAALRAAVARLRPGDVLLVAGKGHETYQEARGVRRPFDDRVELEEAVRCSV